MKKYLRALLPSLLIVGGLVGVAAAGMFTGFPFATSTATSSSAATLPMTGAECIPGDTNLSGGRAPQTACYTQGNIKGNYVVSLTDGATIAWDGSANANLYGVTLGGSRTMAAPTNITTGQKLSLLVTQDATGSRAITWNAAFKWPNGTAPTLTTTASQADLFDFTCNRVNGSGTALACQGVGASSQGRTP